MLQNLHTHSCYDDGKDSIEATVQSAIEKGFDILGFSGHSPNPEDSGSMTPEGIAQYIQDVRNAKEKYAGRIDLYCGIEQDSMQPIDCSLFDYVIGSVHYLPVLKKSSDEQPSDDAGKQQYVAVDYSKEVFDRLLAEGFDNDIQKLAQAYYQSVEQMIEEHDEIDIIGHIDLLSKYNEDEAYFPFDAEWYQRLARKACDAGIRKEKIFEINTGAIARGYRSRPYPDRNLLKYLASQNARLCINSDCHDCTKLDLQLRESAQMAKEAGFKKLYIFKDGKFEACPIEAFLE